MTSSYESSSRARTDKPDVGIPRILNQLASYISSRSRRQSREIRISAKAIGLDKLAPHDLRRTCARLCHASGGELEQIQFLLGHMSVQTTERYLGCKQRIQSAVNDRIGIEPQLSAGAS